MGSVIGTVAEKAGAVLGNTITAPFRNIFSKSCEDKCGEWDGVCFLQNACGASLVRLFKASFLAIITVLFLYLVLWKTGLVKCLVKKSCKLSWKASCGCFRGLCGACGSVCRKLRDTRRIHRGRRRRDVEMGELGWSGSEDESGSTSVGSRKRGRSPLSVRERRKDRMRQSLRPTSRQISKAEHPAKRSRSLHHHHRAATGHDHGRVHWTRER